MVAGLTMSVVVFREEDGRVGRLHDDNLAWKDQDQFSYLYTECYFKQLKYVAIV